MTHIEIACLLQRQIQRALAENFPDAALDPHFALPPPRFYRKSSTLKLADCKSPGWSGWSWVGHRLLTTPDTSDASWSRYRKALCALVEEVAATRRIRTSVVAAYRANVAITVDVEGAVQGLHVFFCVGLKLKPAVKTSGPA